MARSRSPFVSRLLTAETSKEGDRVTTLELFFDLVYVFAFTQITALMAQGHDARAVLQGLTLLVLIWTSWIAYAWLANQAHADRGVVRAGLMAAIALMFLVALVVPEAHDDLEGGLSGPVVFVVCYLAVRVLHGVVYGVAAGTDVALRRQVVLTLGAALLPTTVLLLVGVLVGEELRPWFWLAAAALDLIVIRLTSRGGEWRLPSVAHFAERHGLVVILALGESIVAIGVGAAQLPVSVGMVSGSLLAITIAIGLWWNYFHHLARGVERRVAARTGGDRVAVATDAYTFLHLAVVAGIVLAALGVEQAMAAVDDPGYWSLFGAVALGGGVALYLAGTGVVWRRVSGEWVLVRLGAAAVAAGLVPVLALVHPLAALVSVAALILSLAAAESAVVERRRAASPEPTPR